MSQAPHTPKNVVKTGTCQRLDGKERHIHAKYPQNYSPDSDSKKQSELQNDIYIRNDNDDNNNNDSNDNTNNNKKVLIISKLFSVFIKTEKKKSFE